MLCMHLIFHTISPSRYACYCFWSQYKCTTSVIRTSAEQEPRVHFIFLASMGSFCLIKPEATGSGSTGTLGASEQVDLQSEPLHHRRR
ncbi:hypothetical protein DAI22_02g318750 [Oryza sativa Japonica Group]|nr:hypothetical protein DAI22_02g318750 [Oryza sativa Japonica Group]